MAPHQVATQRRPTAYLRKRIQQTATGSQKIIGKTGNFHQRIRIRHRRNSEIQSTPLSRLL